MSPHRVNQIETGARRRAKDILRINCSQLASQICRLFSSSPSASSCPAKAGAGTQCGNWVPALRGWHDEKKRRIYGSLGCGDLKSDSDRCSA